MGWNVNDMVNVKPGSDTADAVLDESGDVRQQIKNTLEGDYVMPRDALKEWTVVRVAPYVEIRKLFKINGVDIDILTSVVDPDDLLDTKKLKQQGDIATGFAPRLPKEIGQLIGKYAATGKARRRRTRKTKKTRRGRK
jgi:hypothetical protein